MCARERVHARKAWCAATLENRSIEILLDVADWEQRACRPEGGDSDFEARAAPDINGRHKLDLLEALGQEGQHGLRHFGARGYCFSSLGPFALQATGLVFHE